ncbi:MAG: hypothetical protein DWQ08_02445 [Proteobacteria bacterium]|nr:MAG: hypothetical protein DWQ08_02445 [Pseudomonadota bacterium]
MPDIRSIVREILLEELGRRGDVGTGVRREKVSIRNSQDLNAFALRVLELARNEDVGAEIRAGRLCFELDGAPAADRPRPRAGGQVGAVSFEKGLVTEKHIAKLDRAASIRVGKGVCFTPLAKDEIRRKGIKVERKTQ